MDRKIFKEFLLENLDRGDKVKLLLAFTFEGEHLCLCYSINYQTKENLTILKDCSSFDDSRTDNFRPACFCDKYLDQIEDAKVDQYFDRILDEFYEMRNSDVHRGFPIKLEFIKDDSLNNPETSTSSIYLKNSKIIVVSAVDVNIFDVFKNVIINKLNKILNF